MENFVLPSRLLPSTACRYPIAISWMEVGWLSSLSFDLILLSYTKILSSVWLSAASASIISMGWCSIFAISHSSLPLVASVRRRRLLCIWETRAIFGWISSRYLFYPLFYRVRFLAGKTYLQLSWLLRMLFWVIWVRFVTAIPEVYAGVLGFNVTYLFIHPRVIISIPFLHFHICSSIDMQSIM